MQSKTSGYTSDQIANYLVMRLKRENRSASNEPDTEPDTAIRLYQVEQRVRELDRLQAEKADLLKQIRIDRHLVEEETPGKLSREDILNAIGAAGGSNASGIRGLARFVDRNQGLQHSLQTAKQRVIDVSARIGQFITNKEVAEVYEKHLLQKINIIHAARNIEALDALIENTSLARTELLAYRSNNNISLTQADTHALSDYKAIEDRCNETIHVLMGHDDIYYEAKRRTLQKYRRQLLNDGFVETDTIKRLIIDIVGHLQIGTPVFLRGHLGVGKTELALHAARKYFGHEPEFVSGSEEATKYDMYGKTQIGMRSEHDKMREFKLRMDEYTRMNPDKDPKTLKKVEKQYYETIVIQGTTTSFFQYGPVVRALQQGRPLLIDEIDGIPHSIVMRLNHVLTRRPGDTIRIEESGGEQITVRKGFCVLATGNIKSTRYKREELDAAFLSRWWSQDVQYVPPDETYSILIASLLDERGNLQVKNLNDLDDLKRLTEAAAEIQQIFVGNHLDYFGEGADVARQTPAGLKKSVLSLRHMWNIVRPWKARNFDQSLEQYVLREFIRPSVAEDQLYLLQLLCRYRFFKTWQVHDFGIPGLTKAKLMAYQGQKAR